jgi:L-ascorbate metabolism protein UlaG (beta-lactamase superfamily)
MQLTYYGHAMFLLESGGSAILIDPYDAKVGYPIPDVTATAVTVSHEHGDHSNVAAVKGHPKVIRGLKDAGKDWADVNERVGPFTISGVATYHDTSAGKDRGKNTIFVYEAEGLRIAHAGDLGHPLTAEQVSALGQLDVLMLPVGGHFTCGPKEAEQVVNQLRPRVVIPMHYKTEANRDWPIGLCDAFTEGKRPKEQPQTIELSAATLPDAREVWVLSHSST